MFILQQIRDGLAWGAQRLAWRLRRPEQLPRATSRGYARPEPQSTHALRSATSEAAKAAIRFGVRFTARGVFAAIALFGASMCALAANAWLLAEEVGSSSRWLELRSERIRTLVVDRSGLPVGVLGSSQTEVVGEAIVPDHCVDLVLQQEDRHHGQPWRRFRGVDVASMGKLLLAERGASTLPMQMARLLDDEIRHATLLRRKRLELAAAGAIQDAYAGDTRELARDYLRMAPMAIALGSGGTVAGLADFAASAFSKSAAEMSAAECAVAVAALPSPMILNGEGSAASQKNRRVFARALRLLESAGMGGTDDWHQVVAMRDRDASMRSRAMTSFRRQQFETVQPLLGTTGAQP